MRLQLDRVASPIGEIRLLHDENGALRAADFEEFGDRALRRLRRQLGDIEVVEAKAPSVTTQALTAYFAGDLAALGRIPIKTSGTAFQESAWAALREIPVGATRSYSQQATAIGRPKAVRAVGLANGANPVAVVTPCHRVIGAGGALTGYGGGMERKRWLLRHEGAI